MLVMLIMSNYYPLKSLFSLLQIKSLKSKTLKPVAATPIELVSKPKTQEKRAKLVSKPKTQEKRAKLVSKPKTQEKRDKIPSEIKESVITLLKKYDFTDTQIAILEEKRPEIFRYSVESNIEPKLQFLQEKGLVGSLLPDLVVKNPSIMRCSLVNQLIPSYEYLRELMKIDQATTVVVVSRATRILTLDLRKILQPNVEFLLREGMPMSNIVKLLMLQPRSLLYPLAKVRDGVATIRECGVEPSDKMFVHALRVIVPNSESIWKKKVGILKSLGWSDRDIVSTVARYPLCLSQSEEKLRSSFEFFVKTMDMKPEDVINYPKLCMYSLDKRCIPRCKVLMALKDKNLVKHVHMPTLLGLNEDKFTEKFILKYPDHSSSLWNIYRGAFPV